MQRNQQGFTLIELVIVIVILGILSAFALPRFADLGSEARVASLEGAAGAVRSAASITRSAWLAQGQPEDDSGDPEDVTLEEGQTVAVSSNGYPSAIADFEDGILFAAQLSEADYSAAVNNDDDLEISLADGPDGCEFTYDESDGSVSFEEGFEEDC